jgi:hypothetical protein
MVGLNLTISAGLAIIAGVVVLVWKDSLNWVVGGWLIISGILNLISF